ncbi:glycosyltransferase family 39 protein [bacterium]|nr:glycosyltransferase family 39 protein [bacterium]
MADALRRSRVRLALLLAIGIGLFVVLPWAVDPLDGDAAMWATVARTVGSGGDWLRLRFNGEPYYNKPPLFFWLAHASMSAFGTGPFAASLPSGVFGVIDLLLLWVAGVVMFRSSDLGFAAALAFATTHEVVHWTRGVHLESLLVFWNLLGLIAAFRSVDDARAIVPLGLALAGGWLTKGPQGLFPGAVAIALWALEGRLLDRVRSRPAAIAAGAFAAIVLPWLAAQVFSPGSFFREYVSGQIGAVLFGSGDTPHGIGFYPAKLAGTYWPWLPVAAAGGVILAGRWRERAARLWLLDFAVVSLAMLAATVSKTRYLYPLYPSLSIFAGAAVVELGRRVPRAIEALAAAAVAAAVVTALLVGVGQRRSDETLEKRDDAIAIARMLPSDARTWLARGISAEDSPGVGKVLGFHAAPFLCDCGAPCTPSGSGPVRVVTLAADADEVARELGGEVAHRTRHLALVAAPATADVRGTTCRNVGRRGSMIPPR